MLRRVSSFALTLLAFSVLWWGCAQPEPPLTVAAGMQSVMLKVQGMT